jgi:SHOCT-like domain
VNEERLRILTLLETGKIDAAQAASLLDALGGAPSPGAGAAAAPQGTGPRYLRVLVEGTQGDAAGKVNVRVPLNLIRAGVRLAALLPPGLHDQINKALKESGVELDVSKIKPENLEELVEHLGELTVDVEGARGDKVRVFCE